MVFAAAWMMYHFFWDVTSPVELVCYYYSTVHQDGSHPRTGISLTYYIRLVHITEELVSNILHEDGSQPRRTGISRSTSDWFTSQKN